MKVFQTENCPSSRPRQNSWVGALALEGDLAPCKKMFTYWVAEKDVTRETEKWAECAALTSVAHSIHFYEWAVLCAPLVKGSP